MRLPVLSLAFVICLAACRETPKPAPDASPSITPMGLASAVKLVQSANAVEVLTTLRHPSEIVLGGDALYVLDTAAEGASNAESVQDVVSIPLAGGSPKTLFAEQQGAAGLTLAGGRLAWIVATVDANENAGASLMGAKIGAKPDAKPGALAKVYALDDTSAASDGADVFTFGDPSKGGKGDVLRVPPSGKAARVAAVTGRAVRSAIATNSASVFWVQDDALVRAPKAGGEAVIVAKLAASKVQRIVADESAVYWTDHGRGDPTWSGRVYQAALATGVVTPISDAPIPIGIAIDADTVYWTSTGDGRILARKKSGGPTFVLARDQASPVGLVVDESHVYWTNQRNGTVCRADKTPLSH